MGRRRFDHLFVEICLAAGRPLSRYRLWMHLHETGADPEALTRGGALEFCRGPMQAFLSEAGIFLTPREVKKLERCVQRYDPSVPTPEEQLARI